MPASFQKPTRCDRLRVYHSIGRTLALSRPDGHSLGSAHVYTLQAKPAADADAIEPTETDLSAPVADELDGSTEAQLPEEGDDADDPASVGMGLTAQKTSLDHAHAVSEALACASLQPG